MQAITRTANAHATSDPSSRQVTNTRIAGRRSGPFSDFAKCLAGLLASEGEASRFADYLVSFSQGHAGEGPDQQKALVQNLLAQAADLYSLAGMADRANAARARLATLQIGASHGS